uniref:uncharacterized protein n=1 Tax=Myxine glutinosa TaxID=7769 RepID=UPI00358EBB9C
MRDADVDGLVDQQINCTRTNCYDIDCDQKQKTMLNHHKILPNGDLQISKVEKRDSGLYRCLNQPSHGRVKECDSTSSFCPSGDQEEESAEDVTQSSCGAALLLHISDSPQEAKDYKIYKIYIKTGWHSRAGTNSNVYITICGGLKCLRSHHLRHSTTHHNPFERNQVDVFTVRCLYLGSLKNVTIWHDGSRYYSTWLVENIRITEAFSGMEQTFNCSCWISGNYPKTLHPQIPGSCDSLDEREPKKPHVPNTFRGTPLLSCEIQKPPSNKFSLLWMFRSTEGHDRVIAVAGTWADILTSCLGKSKERKHGMLVPGQDSCPESSHCLLPLFGVTRDQLERYWCLIGPGEDGEWREQVLSLLAFKPDEVSRHPDIWKRNGTDYTRDILKTKNQNESTTVEETTNNPSSFSGSTTVEETTNDPSPFSGSTTVEETTNNPSSFSGSTMVEETTNNPSSFSGSTTVEETTNNPSSFSGSTTVEETTNDPSPFSGCRPALAAAITLNVLALFPFTMVVFLVKRYREARL